MTLPPARKLLEAARQVQREKDETKDELDGRDPRFTRKELGDRLGWSKDQVARAIAPLEADYLDVRSEGSGYTYRVKVDAGEAAADDLGLLSVEELVRRIEEHADDEELRPYLKAIGL